MKLTSKIFGSAQKEQLIALGADRNTEIEVLITNHFGGKVVRFNGADHVIK